MRLLDFIKSKQVRYEEQIGKVDKREIDALVDLMPPEMKEVLLSQMSGKENSLTKEEQEQILELIKKVQELPVSDKLGLLTTDIDDLKSFGKDRVRAELCSYLQSKWKEMEERYGEKLPNDFVGTLQRIFPTNCSTYSDMIKVAGQLDAVTLKGALAYSVLLDAYNNGQKSVVKAACHLGVMMDQDDYEQREIGYDVILDSLDRKREEREENEDMENKLVEETLNRSKERRMKHKEREAHKEHEHTEEHGHTHTEGMASLRKIEAETKNATIERTKQRNVVTA